MMRAISYALSGEFRPEYEKIMETMKSEMPLRQKIETVSEIAKPISDALEGTTQQIAFKRFVDLGEHRKRYELGETVDMKFNPDFIGWTCGNFTDLRYVSDDEFIFDNLDCQRVISLKSDEDLPGPKIIRFHLDLTRPDDVFVEDYANITLIAGFLKYENWNDEEVKVPVQIGTCINGLLISRLPNGFKGMLGGSRYQSQVDVELRVTDKYLECYLDSEPVLRQSMENFIPINTIIFQGMPFEDKRIRATISDLTIKKWNGERPPYEKSPEELVKHFEQALEVDPDDILSRHALARAKILAGDLDGARNEFETCLASGISEGNIAFYIGHICDMQGNRDEASKWYQRCIDAETGGNQALLRILNENGRVVSSATLKQSAALRKSWLDYTDPAHELTDEDADAFSRPLDHFGEPWVTEVIKAHFRAARNEFPLAATYLKKVLSQAPNEVKPDLEMQIKAFESNQRYTETQGTIPFYLRSSMSGALFADLMEATRQSDNN
ncbi:MAG: hypothetical protein R3C03_22235 [Pirellulaceae bacterium]